MSQTELEEKLGVDQTTISSFLSGRQGTSFNVAIRIAELAGGDAGDVLGLSSKVVQRLVVPEHAPAELVDAIKEARPPYRRATVLVAYDESISFAKGGIRKTKDEWSRLLRRIESGLEAAGVGETPAPSPNDTDESNPTGDAFDKALRGSRAKKLPKPKR